MKKIFCFVLLLSALLSPVSLVAYAEDTEELVEFSSFVDEVAGMVDPRFAFEYVPQLEYENKFLFFEWGDSKEVAWDIQNVSYYFTLNNEHKSEAIVGYNSTDLEIVFEYYYTSVDDELNEYMSKAAFRYPMSEIALVGDYFELTVPYKDVLAGSEYYELGYDTVLNQTTIYIRSKILNKCGTVAHYEFYVNDNISTQIYTGIDYYEFDLKDIKLISDVARSFKGDNYGLSDGNGGVVETHYFVNVLPDSLQEQAFEISDFFTIILLDVPVAVWNVLKFLVSFILTLPSLITMFLPFLPEFVVSAILYVIVFGLVVFGFVKLWNVVSGLFKKG